MGITRQRARTDLLLAVLACGCALGLFLTSPSSFLAPVLLPGTRVVALGWCLVRLAILDRTLRRWRAWRVNVVWSVSPSGLEQYHG